MGTEQTTAYLQGCLDRLAAGDDAAREQLLRAACERFERLTHRMLRNYPRLKRWEDTGDVLQNATLRLWKTLHSVTPQSPRHFLNLAAQHVRRELIDLARHYYGPHGPAANQDSQSPGDAGSSTVDRRAEPADSSHEPRRLASWTEFHEHIESLPDGERELFDLLWYQGLKPPEVATLLGVTERVVRYRWQQARLQLVQSLGGELPG